MPNMCKIFSFFPGVTKLCQKQKGSSFPDSSMVSSKREEGAISVIT